MTATPSTSPAGAVFLSYAREDSTAVRGIADALRAAGIEVWFDQNELVGGDAWDRKIRAQIKECALFLPVISASTNARAEGYFRLEWLLAVERSRLMADDKAFLVPVVIDATTEAAAKVPDKFRDVQWTRLRPAGYAGQARDDASVAAFVARVQKLLGAEAQPGGSKVGARLVRAQEDGRGPATPLRQPSWTWPVVAVLAIGVAAFFLARKSEPPAAPPKPAAETKTASAPPASSLPSPASAVPLAPDKSIAVLPFVNMSPDADNAFFADGVHEDVITNLAKIRDLKVISRTSVLAYRDPASRNLKKIAAELGVATVLEGSVRRVGTRVRVTAQLIDARTDEHLWAETYDKDLTDVFTIQSALAQEITSALKANLTVGERALIADRPTQSSEAYDLYLRARTIFGADTSKAPTEQAIALFEQAVAKDPAFVAAYAQLVYLNGRMYWYNFQDPTPARRERAKAALDAAVRLAPDKPETRVARGAFAYYCDNDYNRALAEFRAAATLLPNDAQIYFFIGVTLRRMGAYQDAAASMARALELNPRELVFASNYVQILGGLGRYRETRDAAARYVAIFPGQRDPAALLADARLELGHDVAAYVRELAALAAPSNDATNLVTRVRIAEIRGDFASAERELANSTLTEMGTAGDPIGEPVVLRRASEAFLRGSPDAAHTFADEAITYFKNKSYPPHSAGNAMAGTALAHAFAGRSDEAIKLVKESYTWAQAHDQASLFQVSHLAMRVFLVLERRDEAFAMLRDTLSKGYYYGSEQYRLDPFWRRVKDDPRFEEILKLAKPL